MAREFHEDSPAARAVFAEVGDALGLDMAALCFEPDPRLDLTEFTQPAILTAEIAILRALHQRCGLTGDLFAGHSLGEYTALVAAGVIPLAEGARLVRERGRRMQAAVPPGVGAMVAFLHPDLSLDGVGSALEGLEVDVANHNTHNQIVISGRSGDVDVASARMSEAVDGLRVIRLNVSAPFHSRLMATIEPGFRQRLVASAPTWRPELADRVLSNVSGGLHAPRADALIDALTRQISSPVRWVANMETIAAAEPARILEIGPARTLRGFFRRVRISATSITNRVTARRAFPELAD